MSSRIAGVGDTCTNRRTFMTMCVVLAFSTSTCLYIYSRVTVQTFAIERVMQDTLLNIESWGGTIDNLVQKFSDNVNVARRMRNDLQYTNQTNTSDVDNETNSIVDMFVNSTQNVSTSPILLTLFTSWPTKAEKYTCHNITLKNWNTLKPKVNPILFTNEIPLAWEVRKKGWKSLPVHQSDFGTPVLKFMYKDAFKVIKSHFYGYANGDILFTSTLIQTLEAVVNSTLIPKDRPIMIIGRRTNVQNVSQEEAKSWQHLSRTARKRGKLFIDMAEDYFITTADYPWDAIPEVVIGRRAYDNWLVSNARKQKHTTIDATQTLLALHQTTKAGNMEGHRSPHSNYNHNLLSRLYKRLNYGAGRTSCAEYYTRYDDVMKPKVERRIKTC